MENKMELAGIIYVYMLYIGSIGILVSSGLDVPEFKGWCYNMLQL